MPNSGLPYSPEFRAEAVRLMTSSGRTVAELSRELGVSEQTLRGWRRRAAAEAPITVDRPRRPSPTPREDDSMRRLARLTAEVIDAGVVVVTMPAKWAANGLRWYANQDGHGGTKASTGQDGES